MYSHPTSQGGMHAGKNDGKDATLAVTPGEHE